MQSAIRMRGFSKGTYVGVGFPTSEAGLSSAGDRSLTRLLRRGIGLGDEGWSTSRGLRGSSPCRTLAKNRNFAQCGQVSQKMTTERHISGALHTQMMPAAPQTPPTSFSPCPAVELLDSCCRCVPDRSYPISAPGQLARCAGHER